MKRIIAVGLNFRTAPVELREKLAFPSQLLVAALKRLTEEDGLAEAALLSTCNRTEIYALVESQEAAAEELFSVLADYSQGLSSAKLRSQLYVHVNREAVEHLFAVACGIDSQVLGEPQVLGQVQEAFEQAMHFGAVKSVLAKLFQGALSAGKRARTQTQIGRNAASISSVAVELAQQILGHVSAKKVLLIGAGKMGELAVKNLLKHGVQEVLIANRTYERARERARQFAGQAIRLEELPQALVQADVVISSTAAPSFILRATQVKQTMQHRAERPLLLIDIAVPRDIDPVVKQIPNVYLYDIDDLQGVAEVGLGKRRREVAKVKAIIREEADEFMAWLEARDAVHAIVALRERVEKIRQQELHRALRRLQGGRPAQHLLEEFSVRLVNKFLHEPTERLKKCTDKDGRRYRETLGELFGLSVLKESRSMK
jgi:glutamyl-tRNA reductase